MDKPVSELLYSDAPAFDFFQAVRLLERMYPAKQPLGREALPGDEVVRIRSHLSLSFPPSALHAVEPPEDGRPYIRLIQTFMGLTGPSGVLPRHYTQLLMDLGRDVKGPERRSLGDWLAMFDHRIVSLFYRAWEKYRFHVAYERGEAFRREPDMFTASVFGIVGLGTPMLRDRLRVAERDGDDQPERPLARIDDLALLYYAGLFAQRPRCAIGLEAILSDYFELPVSVSQFRGQWLPLDREDQTRLGTHGRLGMDAIAGERVWDVQAAFRIRLGPLRLREFEEYLPDRSPTPRRKSLFLLAQLVRLYVGPELDFDVQLVLNAAEVPSCLLGGEGFGARLGWNTWIISRTPDRDADDAYFVPDESVWVN